jgi:hypothetical protein
LVRLSQRPQQIRADRARIDQRVPPAVGQERLYNDSFVFQGSSPDGVLVMTRLGLRGAGDEAEAWLWIELDGRKLVIPRAEVPAEGRDVLAAGGLRYTRDAMRDRWRVQYDGPLSGGPRVGAARCELDLEYRPTTARYLSSEHMDPLATGKAMAEMPWSRAYFRRLRSERQVRMEQGGTLSGSITLDGARRELALSAIRDHSWGKRDWTFLNRYIWNIVSLDAPLELGGEPFTHLCYTTVDYGDSFSHLVSGWIAGPRAVLPIVAASDMGALAADGVIPRRYPIAFQPRGQRPLCGEVERSSVDHSWMMQDGAFEVNEAYCRVQLEGVSGHGMSELGFARQSGIARPVFGASR